MGFCVTSKVNAVELKVVCHVTDGGKFVAIKFPVKDP